MPHLRSAAARATKTVLAAVALLVSTGAAWNGPPDTAEFEYSPTQGPPGTTISVSGTCLFGGIPAEAGVVTLIRRDASPDGTLLSAAAEFPTDDDGAFAGQLIIPESFPPSEYTGQYTLTLSCRQQDQVFGVEQHQFVITPGPTPPSTTTSTPPGPLVPPAPPARPVPGQPSFTG